MILREPWSDPLESAEPFAVCCEIDSVEFRTVE
jgi:hypothetical protein